MNAARPDRGAALLTAMLTVTLVATLATGALWQHWRGVEIEQAQQQRSRFAWILIGALDWARLILREDARASQIDHLSEPWALALEEARLSNFLAVDANHPDDTMQAFLSGQISDLQGRMNLANLIEGGAVSEPALWAFGRLFALLGLPSTELQTLAHQLRISQATLPTAAASAGSDPGDRPLLPQRIEQLSWLGLPPASIERLRPHVTWLPVATPLNLNTAHAEVIHANIAGLDFPQAQQFVRQRASGHFRTVAEALRAVNSADPGDASRFSVSSRFFEVRGRLRLGQDIVQETSLLERNGLETRIVWRQRSPVNLQTAGMPASLQ